MPPKVKIRKEQIVEAALELVREQGEGALNARSIAEKLGCSTQPVFSNFASMEELSLAVREGAAALYKDRIRREAEAGEFPPYKASGMGYIFFAKEERELFKLLFMRDRAGKETSSEVGMFVEMRELVQRSYGLEAGTAELFHLEMWAYVHGIATMMATGYLELERDIVSRMLTDAFLGLSAQFGKG